MTSHVIPLIDNLEIIRSVKLPVIVWFTVPVCPPCRAIEPRVNQLIEKHGDEFKIYKFDITKNPSVAQKLEITSTPTFIFFTGGVETGRLDGFPSLSEFEDVFNNLSEEVK